MPVLTKRTRSDSCPNCGHNFISDNSDNNYCPDCGQENNNPRVSLSRLVKEVIQSFVSFDSKFWRSVKSLLFSPGTITKNYIDNKRQRYTSPVKLFLIVSAFSLTISVLVDKSFVNKPRENELRSDSISFSDQFDVMNDSVKYDFAEFPLTMLIKSHPVSVADLRKLKLTSQDSVNVWLESQGFGDNMLTRLIANNAKKEISSELTRPEMANFAGKINNILLFFLIPVSSLIFYLALYKKGRMYYDVLIFTLHSVTALIIFNLAFFTIINLWNMWGRSELYHDFTYFVIFAFVLNIIPAAKKVFRYSWSSVVLRMLAALLVLLFISIVLQRVLLTYW